MVLVWIGLLALVVYAVSVRAVEVRRVQRRTTKDFDESLVTAATVCFMGGFLVSALVALMVSRWAPFAGGVVLLGCSAAALLLMVHAVVLRCRRALAIARERRAETDLNYKALLPGWVVGLGVVSVVRGSRQGDAVDLVLPAVWI